MFWAKASKFIRWWADEIIAGVLSWVALICYVVACLLVGVSAFADLELGTAVLVAKLLSVLCIAVQVLVACISTAVIHFFIMQGQTIVVPADKYIYDIHDPAKKNDWSGYFSFRVGYNETYYLYKVDKSTGCRETIDVVFHPIDRWKVYFYLKHSDLADKRYASWDKAQRAYAQLAEKEKQDSEQC